VTAALRGIYCIANQSTRDDASRALTVAASALTGGIRIVQYRAKGGVDEDVARELRRLTRHCDALFIMNDCVEAAVRFDCDGVHLGPGDAGFDDLAGVRAALGDRIIGLSCGTLEEARAAQGGGADYIGAGAVFATQSKDDAGEPIGIDGLHAIVAATTLRVAAIGGIDAQRLADVRATGAAMAAVLSALAPPHATVASAKMLVQAWGEG
jgi:thiamine-phosphate pyrophosphorylase